MDDSGVSIDNSTSDISKATPCTKCDNEECDSVQCDCIEEKRKRIRSEEDSCYYGSPVSSKLTEDSLMCLESTFKKQCIQPNQMISGRCEQYSSSLEELYLKPNVSHRNSLTDSDTDSDVFTPYFYRWSNYPLNSREGQPTGLITALCCSHDGGSEQKLPYITQIYLHKREIERRHYPIECLFNQPQITPLMRQVTVEWIAKINTFYQYSPETYATSVCLIDRFLSCTPIAKDCLKLLGVTAVVVAGKLLEVYPPCLKGIADLCDDLYTVEQIAHLERLLLSKLEFLIAVPTSQFFLELYNDAQIHSKQNGFSAAESQKIRNSKALGHYLLESSLNDYSIIQYIPSQLAFVTFKVCMDFFVDHDVDQKMFEESLPQIFIDNIYEMEDTEQCMIDMKIQLRLIVESCPDLNLIIDHYSTLYDIY